MKWFVIFKNNFKRSLNKKTSFAIILIVPILVVILGVVANYFSKPSFNIGIIDTKRNKITINTIQALKHTNGINTESANLDTLKTDIIMGRYSAVVKFTDSGFSINSIKDQHTINILSNIVGKYMKKPKPVDISKLYDTSIGIPQRTCAFIVLFLMITATVNASLIVKDKNNGTFKRYLYSPCTSTSYVLGNIVYNFIITYFQFFIAVSVVSLFKINAGISYSNYLLLGIWITALATAFGTCMASIFDNEMYASLFSTCIALILSLVGGTFIAIEKMPSMLQRISIISPLRWFIEAINSMERGSTWLSDYKCITVLTFFIIIFFLIAAVKNKNIRIV